MFAENITDFNQNLGYRLVEARRCFIKTGNKMTVNIGDKFSKLDAPDIVWTVSRIIEENFPLPHVILVEEGRPARQITLSVPALEIKSMYTRLDT